MEANQWPQLMKVDNEEKIEINASPFLIGRGIKCNKVIPSKLVSRIHCIFTKTKDGWILTDKSTNGTILNGKIMKGASSNVLKESDLIVLMEEPHVYMFHPSPQPPPAAVGENVAKEKIESGDELQQNHSEPEAKIKSTESPQNYMDIIEDQFTCSICSELFIKSVTLNCSHSFCKYCIEIWQQNKSLCPICRTEIIQINPSLVLDNYIAKVLEKAPDEVKERRKNVMAERVKEKQNALQCRSLRHRQQHEIRNNFVRITDSTATIVHSNEPVIIELSDSETDEDDPDEDDDSSYFDDDSEFQIEMHDWEDEFINQNWLNIRASGYATRSGGVYRTNGACYTCGERGHWANGCPNRGSRRN